MSNKVNISMRSLRYYDNLNLLNPSFKDENGRRYYNEKDLLKLEKIAVLKILGFNVKEMKKILDTGSITRELEYQESIIESKIKHLRLIKKGIGIAKSKMNSEEDLVSLSVELKGIFKEWEKEFHTQSRLKNSSVNQAKDNHDKRLKVLRKLAKEKVGEKKDYLKLLEYLPKLKEEEFLSQYFVMLRLSKSSKFKLDEIDNIEKNLKKFIKSLDSDIM